MQTIDLISFLRNYYGINNGSLSFHNLVHEDIKKLFPYITTCNYEYINKEDIISGNIIGVYDMKGRIVYYNNPHLTFDDDMEITYNEQEEIVTISLNNIDILSKDELLKLRKKVRLLGLQKESNRLTKMIHQKKQKEPKAYRKRKEMLRIKESYYD